jgi:Zn-dependent membrane protease YugP
MPIGFWDPTMILLIPAIILAIWAQMRVSSTYKKYSEISSARGATGADTAKFLLQHNGLSDVKIEAVEGKLSDHYDPRSKTVRLSVDNYKGRSLSAVAVAAHEVGHAVRQGNHDQGRQGF